MEDYLTVTNTTDITVQISTAAMYLKKTARRRYRTNKASLTTFDILKTKITAHFIPANYCTQLMLQWDSLKQDKKSVSDFVLEIRTLADKLDKGDVDRVHSLTFGINPKFRSFLIIQLGSALAPGETEFNAISKRAMRLEQAEKMDRLASPAAPVQPLRRFIPIQNVTVTRTRPPPAVSTSSNWNKTGATTPSTSGKRAPLTQAENEYLQSVNGCYYCCQEQAGHMSMDCPEMLAHEARKRKYEARVKQELNYVSERDEDEYDFVHAYPSACVIPPIVILAKVDDTKVQALVDTGGSSNFISPEVVQRTRIQTSPTSPSLLHQALSPKPTRITEQVVAKQVDLPSQGISVLRPTVFKVASLGAHDVVLGIPFLADNQLLIDAKARKLVPRQRQPNVPIPAGHVRVGNALMIESPPEGFTRVGNTYMELSRLGKASLASSARARAESKPGSARPLPSRPSLDRAQLVQLGKM
jgi:hypothetical protein